MPFYILRRDENEGPHALSLLAAVDMDSFTTREAAEEAARVHYAQYTYDIAEAPNWTEALLAATLPIIPPEVQDSFREKMLEIEQSGGPRDFEDLLRVVPVAQSASYEATRFLLLSVESYADGFLIPARIITDHRALHRMSPLIEVTAHDDTGRQYTYDGSSGGGLGREHRLLLSFRPTLDPAAKTLSIVVTRVNWSGMDMPDFPAIQNVRTVEGPEWTPDWRFEISV